VPGGLLLDPSGLGLIRARAVQGETYTIECVKQLRVVQARQSACGAAQAGVRAQLSLAADAEVAGSAACAYAAHLHVQRVNTAPTHPGLDTVSLSSTNRCVELEKLLLALLLVHERSCRCDWSHVLVSGSSAVAGCADGRLERLPAHAKAAVGPLSCFRDSRAA
jgi:hypothetical protein